MRNSEKFQSIWKELNWYTSFHKTPVWLVPKENDYCLSVVKPLADELPKGTCANLYDKDLSILDSVDAE